jgi:hypothetical protein
MKRILMAALALTLLAALVPAKAAARHTLAHRVSTLEAKLACMTRTPVFEYGNPAGNQAGPGYLWDNDESDGVLALDNSFSALDFYFTFDTSVGDPPPDVWLLTVKATSACRSRFARTPTPEWWPLLATTAKSAAAATLSARAE